VALRDLILNRFSAEKFELDRRRFISKIAEEENFRAIP